MKKLAKRTTGIALALLFSVTVLMLLLLFTLYLVAYIKNMGV